MSYYDKYNNSKEFANIAYNDAKYDIAVNRMYYAIYQKILCSLEREDPKLIKFNETNTENTHNSRISIYRDKVLISGAKNKKKFKTKSDFNKEIDSLKRLRHCADYKPNLLKKNEADDAKRKFNILDKIVL